MINREITYERNMTRSYMIIPSMPEENFDEKMILKKTISGLLPVEKCYVAGLGQYWYNITGKQALDTYCRENAIGNVFFENLILRFCEQVEVLEWNLIDVNCLVADPEVIFVNHSGEEISFVVYPYHKEDLATELRQLIEYLLTKIDHKDTAAVGAAYKIYEMTLSEGISAAELKKYILEGRMKAAVVEPQKMDTVISVVDPPSEIREAEEISVVSKAFSYLEKKLGVWYAKVKTILEKKGVEMPVIVYPEEKPEEEPIIEIHPTICINGKSSEPRGELVSDRKDIFPNFQLEQGTSILGKNPKVQLQIEKDTISQFHARIEYVDNGYYIEDLNSTNGTYINDQVLSYKKKQRLEAGDSLRFADVGYHFY